MTATDLLLGGVLAAYLLVLAYVTVYCLLQLHLLTSYLRDRREPVPSPPEPASWPRVTVQLPLYNERYVATRVIDAVCGFDYPPDRLQVQVLDDSTDDTVAIVAHCVMQWRAAGIDIVHVRRERRHGFKAGALADAMSTATGEFIAIFDADFVPAPDFLRASIPYFHASEVGVVQSRWEHLNEDYSLITRLQALQLNVDATAMSQAFMGARDLGRILQRELLDYAHPDASAQVPIGLTSRALFNANLQGGWFLALLQIVNHITILAVLLTGTALLREREHGTLDHLLVLPLTALEIMLAKIWSNAVVVVICTWLSLELVVKGALGVPLAGSQAFFLAVTALYLFASTALGIFLATLARSIPQFGLLAIPVIIPMLMLSGGSTPMESMPVWLQQLMQLSPSTHYLTLSTSILFRDAGPGVVWPELAALTAIGLVFFGLALRRFRSSLTA